ncbi:MAG: hypothetical protein WAO20_05935 [Acidobacteriota bacterium]
MNKSRLLIILGVLALLVATTPALLGQSDPKIGYTEWPTMPQSRNIPAGTVNDPGSHLTYLLDTGVNARELLGDVSLASATGTPLTDLAAYLDVNGDGQLDPGSIIQNFVAITNTHPTMAVTIHFRYFNDNCDDILDFLVILTCNDTLLFDPFNFEIPGSGGENTKDRIFGPKRPGHVLSPVPTAFYGSGRFIMTASAAGASIDNDDDPEILFPYETAVSGHCNMQGGTDLSLDGDLDEILSGSVRNIGVHAGLVWDNLHVFNAFQISFNYLIGFQTFAVPRNQVFQAGGINAWARPAIDRDDEVYPDVENSPSVNPISNEPDGDGPQATTGKIVLGGEVGTTKTGPASTALTTINPNYFFLRNDVHGGDIRGIVGLETTGGYSLYGAMGTSSFFPVDPADIVQHFISITDDYNGSNNAASGGFSVGTFIDRSANIGAAATTYVLQIYDNNENLLEIIPNTPLNVSPPVVGESVTLKMVCMCLRTFITDVITPGTNVDDMTIAELAAIIPEVLTGKDPFTGLLTPHTPDIGGGWIRYVRDNTNKVSLSVDEAAAIGFPIVGTAHGEGTSTFDVVHYADSSDLYGPSFLTTSMIFTKQSGFGALWWNYAVASDAVVSETGDPNPATLN